MVPSRRRPLKILYIGGLDGDGLSPQEFVETGHMGVGSSGMPAALAVCSPPLPRPSAACLVHSHPTCALEWKETCSLRECTSLGGVRLPLVPLDEEVAPVTEYLEVVEACSQPMVEGEHSTKHSKFGNGGLHEGKVKDRHGKQ